MNPSLSVLLPIRNVQASLQTSVQKVLDVLPELTRQFEVLIIDDGSTDATCEVAYELARDYPQVSVISNAVPVGWAASISKPAMQARGEFLIVHCSGVIDSAEIAAVWRLRQGIAAGTLAKAKAAQTGKSWRVDSQANLMTPSQENRLPEVDLVGGLGIHARARRSNLLLVHRRQISQLDTALAKIKSAPPYLLDGPKRQNAEGLKPPSFLGRIKSFAWGE